MTLSSLFGGTDGLGRSSYVQFSGLITDAVVTSSPAILTSIMAGGNQTGGATSDLPYYGYIIKDGTTTVYQNTFWVNYPPTNIPAGGIYCPNGIRASTISLPSYGPISIARLTISYVLV